MRCIARHGRFCEIGKFDLEQDHALGMHVFLKDVSFHGIALDLLVQKSGTNVHWNEVRERQSRRLSHRLQVRALFEKGLRDGVVQPLPMTMFDSEHIEDAFRYMGTGKHVGKVASD